MNRCDPPCGNRDDEPDKNNALAWDAWAASLNYRGYTQSRCPKCGLYTVWSK